MMVWYDGGGEEKGLTGGRCLLILQRSKVRNGEELLEMANMTDLA